MKRAGNGFYFLIVITLLLIGCNKSDSITKPTPPQTGVAGDGTLPEILDYVRTETGVVAISAILFKDGEIVEIAAAGTIKKGGSEAVSTASKWHIGSITKPMTSTLAGVLVESELINWDSTIIDIFPDYAAVVHEEYHDIRLEELLSHTSGIGEIDLDQWYESTEEITDQRLEAAGEALTSDFDLVQGEFYYSNTGFVIAAAMLERVGGASWEQLITERLFVPLEMVNTGFLAPTDASSPWGHSPDNETPLDPNTIVSDNPAVLGPAGVVHTTLADIAKFINLHLDKGVSGTLLTPSTFNKLHTGVVDLIYDGFFYASGWNVSSDGSLMFHAGSNLRWLAELTINHEKNLGMFVAINMAGPKAGAALNQATEYLINREEAMGD